MRTGSIVLDSLTLSVLDYATGDTVAITTDQATVAQWRQARSEAIHHNDMRSLQVYKAATDFLEEAERYGFADDDVLLQRLAEKGHPTALRLVNNFYDRKDDAAREE
jgi:hypothetical protein